MSTVATSCKKTPKEYTTVKDILTHHRWEETGSSLNGQILPMDSCISTGIYFVLNDDSTGYNDDENTRCIIYQPRKDPFYWRLSPGNDTIFLEFKYNTVALTITSLNNSYFSYTNYIPHKELDLDSGTYTSFYKAR